MAEAKELQVRKKGATEWNGLPGSTADLSLESSSAEDSILGATYESSQPTLINWSVSGEAYYRGFAGYKATIKKESTSDPITDIAMEEESAGVWIASSISDSPWDINESVTVSTDDGTTKTDVTDQVDRIDYLMGRVYFVDTYTVPSGETIVVDANVVSLQAISNVTSIELSQTDSPVDVTSFSAAQANGGYNVFEHGLRNSDISADGFYNSTEDFWSLLTSQDRFIVEVTLDPNGDSTFRGYYRMSSDSLSGSVGEPEEESVEFMLSVPQNAEPVSWRFEPTTTMPKAMQDILETFINRDYLEIRYLPEGEGNRGFEGETLVEDASISIDVDGIVTSSADFQGTDGLTEINAS